MGEPQGFTEFVSANSRSLLRAAWLLTGDWSTAEDLVQTSLAAAWPRWSSIATSPHAYVRKIMTTTYLRWRRRRWTGEVPTEALPEPMSTEADGDARLSIQAALATLPARQRAAVVLRYFADLSEADTAAALGCSVGAVKSHTARALARLRELPALAEILDGGVAR